MKRIDLFLGIKAEQTLRDAARSAESQSEGVAGPELVPTGKKDWIAGTRIDSEVDYGELERRKRAVVTSLIGLGSHQRVRQESVRLFAVRQPVPVFKDPVPEELSAPAEPVSSAATTPPGRDLVSVECPVCGVEVNTYNIQYDPWGRMVGCYLCRGEAPEKSG
jgi:hypothetical protein